MSIRGSILWKEQMLVKFNAFCHSKLAYMPWVCKSIFLIPRLVFAKVVSQIPICMP